ncbi:DeoR family transcriptional regulator [Hymenobacter sp. ASUV-10]|uniref:DeoR family transcriptional regulator n=1 Tax=Hymenobacter aranciens TaxID=3063996 RepID=A0ABT9BHD4_9BACT|nr:DeoR family transcriptional regulator [Hymenobacter sp. ASUV-10]MDO7877667.1 DeoR family transcriptional regulator [Hymenobacter sp. ASUV-10]
MGQTLLATITSEAHPQSGQKHRSSGNFSTEGMPSGTKYILFTVQPSGSDNPNAIHFDVMQDKSAAIDPTRYANMYNNSQGSYLEPQRSLYIANPTGATANFTVSVYAVTA